MLDVTSAAKELLRTVESPQPLRLQPVDAEGRLGLAASGYQRGDQVIEESGQQLLWIASEVSQQLDGHRLDRMDTTDGPRLTIIAPNQPAAVN